MTFLFYITPKDGYCLTHLIVLVLIIFKGFKTIIMDIHVKDPLAMIRADETGIQNVLVDEKEGCQACQWRYWCAGGCPLETFRATGRYDLKSPNCSIYKALYPEVLRLEGLRLLKYAEE
jgi:uncharacterized protein